MLCPLSCPFASQALLTTVCASTPLMKMGRGRSPILLQALHQLCDVGLLGDDVLAVQQDTHCGYRAGRQGGGRGS